LYLGIIAACIPVLKAFFEGYLRKLGIPLTGSQQVETSPVLSEIMLNQEFVSRNGSGPANSSDVEKGMTEILY
jgi:hypothetical protein